MALGTEFGDDTCIEQLRPMCHGLLEANDSDSDDWLLYLLVLVGAFAFFRMIALFALVQKARHFY